MAITVEDIQNKDFERSFRGYNADEVDDFLENLAMDYDIVIKENVDLSERIKKFDEERKQYQELAASADKAISEANEKIIKLKEEYETELQAARAEADREIERLNQECSINKRENNEFQKQIHELNKQVMGFEKIEEQLQSSISCKKEASFDLNVDMQEKTDLIKKEVKREDLRIIEDVRHQADLLFKEHEDLQKQVNAFKMRFRSFVEEKLAALEIKDLSDPFTEENDA